MNPNNSRIIRQALVRQQPSAELRDLAKPVEAIYIRPSKGVVTLAMHKTFNILLARAVEQGRDQEVYRIKVSQLGSDLESDSKNTEFLKETVRKLQGFQVEWDYITDMGKRKWGVSSMIASAEIEEGGLIEYTFAKHLKDKLLNPEIYARLNLKIQNRFRSRHALALYEHCARYRDNPSSLSTKLLWQQWAEMLVSPADKDALYLREFKYFSRDVLKPSIIEVNKLSDDIEIEALIEKEGKRVKTLQFRISRKKQAPLLLEEIAHLFNGELRKRLEAFGIPLAEISRVFNEYDEARVRSAVEYTEKRVRNTKLSRVDNVAAYFRDALDKNYARPPVNATQQVLSSSPRLSANDKGVEGLKEKFEQARVPEAKRYFLELAGETQKEVFNRFLEATPAGALRASFERSGLAGKMAASPFFKWLAQDTWGEPTTEELLNFAAKHIADQT